MKCKIIDDEVYEHHMFYRTHQEMKAYTAEDIQQEFFSSTEIAPYVYEHARDLKWTTIDSFANLMQMFILTGYMRPQDHTFIQLKFGVDKHFEIDTVV